VVSTPLCAPLPETAQFDMSGTGTSGTLLTVSPGSVAFNTVGGGQGTAVPCGVTTGLPKQTVTITNSSGATIHVAPAMDPVTDENGDMHTFGLSPSATFDILTGHSATVQITAPPIPTPTATHSITIGAALYKANLTLGITGGVTATRSVPVSVFPFGTLMSFNPGALVSHGGGASTTMPRITSFAVRNLGNQPAGVSLAFTGPASLDLVQPAQAPNATAQLAANGQSVTLDDPRIGQGGGVGITEEIDNDGATSGASSVALSLTSGAQCQAALPTLTVTVQR
jgi:hypothetical protein